MKLFSLNHDSTEIGLGKAFRLVAEMGPEILKAPSPEYLYIRDPKTGEYWSIEEDRYVISLLNKLIELVSGELQIDEKFRSTYPDLGKGVVNKRSRKQAVVFLCRQQGDYSKRIPSLDERDFWGKLERVFPAL